MNTNLSSPLPSTRGLSGESWAALLGVVGSALLVVRKLLRAKGHKGECVTRAECAAGTAGMRERLATTHLAVLEKLETHHREVLAALERQGNRLGAVERAVARLEESSQMRNPSNAGCGLRNAE